MKVWKQAKQEIIAATVAVESAVKPEVEKLPFLWVGAIARLAAIASAGEVVATV